MHGKKSTILYAILSFYNQFKVTINSCSKIIADCKLYVLESVNIIRKYGQLIDLPISLLFASYWYFLPYEERIYIKVSLWTQTNYFIL